MTVINKWYFSVFFSVLSVAILPFCNFFSTNPFKLESSVWCVRSSNQTKLCKFKNVCYDSQFKTLLFFLGRSTVIKGFDNYTELQKIQLSSVQHHNQFYANVSVIDIENYTPEKELIIHSRTFLFSRFKPNNIMHSIHDDIFPLFLTLESVCLGDVQCMESYTLMFHDNHPEGPFFNLYKLFSKHSPIVLNKLNSNVILCFEEMLAGLTLDGIFYQYGFKKPHGPVKTILLTQSDVWRFASLIKEKLKMQNEERDISELVLFNRKKNRKILNVDEVKEMVEDVYRTLNKKVQVNVINLNLFSNSIRTLINTISQADGLIGMHGAEMVLGLFLKPNSYLFEIFPFGIKPEVVSFIKPVSELDGCNFMYFPWKNMQRNYSIPHPDAHPLFGGISHLDEVTQNKIKSMEDIPPFECCSNPIFLYYMYQDTFISNEFKNYFYESLTKALSHKMHSEPMPIIKNWFYPYTVHNTNCSYELSRKVLHINWQPPHNVKNDHNLWYSLYIRDQKVLFATDISTEKTTLEVEIPEGVNPVFEIWISVYFRHNKFKSPDFYRKCY